MLPYYLHHLFAFFSILGPHPNSYTYSKRLTEIIVRDMGKELPLSIARPSIGKISKVII